MAQVFISFIHEEIRWAEAVQSFIGTVLGETAAPFMSSDKFQVYAGEKWLDRIMDELKTAKVVLLMLSEVSVKRPWVNFEAGAAWTRDIITIPICFGGLKKDNLPKPYSSLQAIDLARSGEYEYLARSVAHHLGIEEPPGMLYAVAGGVLGDEESARKFKHQLTAYHLLMERISALQESSS
jgi:hypothetical protein